MWNRRPYRRRRTVTPSPANIELLTGPLQEIEKEKGTGRTPCNLETVVRKHTGPGPIRTETVP